MKFNLFSEDVRKVFDHEEELLSFSTLLNDTARNTVREYTVQEANDAIRAKFHEVLGTDERSTRKELKKAIRRHKVDIFEIIEETVENLLVTGWGNDPFFREFVEMRNLSIGDENEFYVPDENSILTVSEVSGNHHSLIRQRLGFGSTYKVKTSWYGVKIYAEMEMYLAKKVDWAGFVQKIYQALDRKMNTILYSALMAAGSKLPANAQFNKTSALSAETKATFLTLVEDVQAATGHEVVIMGTRTALSKLTPLAETQWISEKMKDERNTTGAVGIWEGIKLVTIPQVFADNDTSTKLVDNNKLLIMPLSDNKFIKLVNEGDAQIAEVSDGTTNVDKTIEYEYQHKLGVSVIINMLFGVWTIA